MTLRYINHAFQYTSQWIVIKLKKMKLYTFPTLNRFVKVQRLADANANARLGAFQFFLKGVVNAVWEIWSVS